MEKNNSALSVGVVFITHQAKSHLQHCLPPFLNSPLKPRVLVVNSSSNDGTAELAKEMGAETLVIPRIQFNHGLTRELARKHLNTDIIIMATPDAYAKDCHTLYHLIDPLLKNRAAVSYARQVPHEKAGFFESFPRDFNYPKQSELRSIEDIKSHGVYTFFCSNTCAAYLNSALDAVGGFEKALFGEDTVAVAKLLRKGYQIAYTAEAVVRHSHRYTLKQEFKRHFDIGLARKSYAELLHGAGKDSKRGKEFVKVLIKRLIKKRPHFIPYACLQIAAKLVGYKLGRFSTCAPVWWKKKLSSQDFYWDSIHH